MTNIEDLIAELTVSFKSIQSTDLSTLKTATKDIQTLFYRLSRPSFKINQLIDLKYKMQHWRRKVLLNLVQRIKLSSSAADGRTILEILLVLDIKPRPSEQLTIFQAVVRLGDTNLSQLGCEYFAQINEHHFLEKISGIVDKALFRVAGPAKKLPIYANSPSRWTYEKWSQFSDFSNYLYQDGGVVYRGVHFVAGDIVLSNVNRHGNGVFTFHAEPKSYSYHLGVLAVVKHGDRQIPVICEAYKQGVRIVPLSIFLSDQFNSYVEVLRLKNPPTDFHNKVNEYALSVETVVKGYNFDTEDPDQQYLSCTGVGNYFLRNSGAQPISTKSQYAPLPQLRQNLESVGITSYAFLSPSDFLVDESMQLVGVIDNNHFFQNVTRELCERKFLKILSTLQIRVSHLPMIVGLSEFAIHRIRSRSLIGKVVALFAGFTVDNLPKGPAKVLALIEFYEHLLRDAVAHTIPFVESFIVRDSQIIDIDAISSDQLIEKAISPNFKPITDTCQEIAQTEVVA